MKLKSWIQDTVEQLLQGLVATFPTLKDRLRYTVHMGHGAVFVYFDGIEKIIVEEVIACAEKDIFKKSNLRREDWKSAISFPGGYWAFYTDKTNGFFGTVKFGWCYKESAFFEESDTGEAFWGKLCTAPEELEE